MKLLRLEEVAVKLGLSYMQVRSMIEAGQIKAMRIGNRSVRVQETEVDRYISSRNEKEVGNDTEAGLPDLPVL